jgi:D-alanine transaminase
VYVAASRFTPPDAVRARGAAAITVPDERWGRCDLKTIQLLPNVLAKQRATRAGAYDAVHVRDGIVTEGAHTNLLAVLDGVIRTHPAGPRILSGITRELILEIAPELGLSTSEAPIRAVELSRAAEVFLTGTTTDVMPVVRLDGKPVGTGQPGPVALQLHAKLREQLHAMTTTPAA